MSRNARTERRLVTACHDGHAALAAIASGGQAFDIAVVDYNMPGMQGDELVRRMLQLAPMPVVLVSGNVNPQLRELATASGARAVMDKSVLYGGLASLLRALVQEGA